MYVYSTDKMLNYVNKCNCASTIRKAVCIQSEEVWAEERRKCGGARGIEKDSQYCFPWNTSRNTNGASGPWFCPQMTQTTAVWTLSVLRHWPFIFPIKALKTNALKKKWMHVIVKGKSELLWGTGREGWVTGKRDTKWAKNYEETK